MVPRSGHKVIAFRAEGKAGNRISRRLHHLRVKKKKLRSNSHHFQEFDLIRCTTFCFSICSIKNQPTCWYRGHIHIHHYLLSSTATKTIVARFVIQLILVVQICSLYFISANPNYGVHLCNFFDFFLFSFLIILSCSSSLEILMN